MQEKEVRVRYAPSPTGMQHIGGVRTALFNYLFARSKNGKFILRLEDTDRTRYDEKYVKNLYDTMDWLGIDWDEGGSKGGPFGPYVQSERFALYKEYAMKLIENGEAYYCFCDAERLDRIRKIQTENKMAPGYDRNCRHLTAQEVKANLDAGKPYVIRLKVPMEGVTKFHDHILGDIEWKNEDISPDPVLLKSDGFPTYHLANIVDDHFMKISHVMRAQEWIPSTPLHVQMYRSFGWEHPEFCHLPMVNGSDGKKLSKRHGSTSVNEFRARGYLPQAIVNYVAMLGCSYEEGKEFYTLEELSNAFKLEHLNKAPAVFDYKKLEYYNANYIRRLSIEELYKWTLPFITGTGDAMLEINPENPQPKPNVGPEFSGVALDENGQLYCVDKSMNMSSEDVKNTLMGLMPLIQERLKFLTEAAEMIHFMFTEPAVPPAEQIIPKKLDIAKTKEVLEAAKDFVHQVFKLNHEEAEELAKSTAEKLGIKLGDFMMPIRMAVTGSRVSPPLIGSIIVLGEEKSIARIEKTIAAL
ncbi:glutamate--tRNA ligase [Treponema sp. Marseille-Q3903]|uniref:glutamate--tRNA ligase n=1 Tax=Treponema sp. Marseille-Q3903 TaxID=2766703 RepID=UPI001652AA5C|nr:glutamate--tRNA ligase [Treponema sp. Marseille-Q3903]MBC6713116.1 glutamate--tRNA ligase [Treponema sp. Marseille-Q3903]